VKAFEHHIKLTKNILGFSFIQLRIEKNHMEFSHSKFTMSMLLTIVIVQYLSPVKKETI